MTISRSESATFWPGSHDAERCYGDASPRRDRLSPGGLQLEGQRQAGRRYALAFANALTANKLLDAEHTKLLTTGKVDTPRGKYAYGFVDRVVAGVRCFGHGGGAPGMNGELTICENGYTIAVLANLDPPAASRVEQFILNRLPMK
jgi:hypothetical protein